MDNNQDNESVSSGTKRKSGLDSILEKNDQNESPKKKSSTQKNTHKSAVNTERSVLQKTTSSNICRISLKTILNRDEDNAPDWNQYRTIQPNMRTEERHK